jgi:hypothetical protein
VKHFSIDFQLGALAQIWDIRILGTKLGMNGDCDYDDFPFDCYFPGFSFFLFAFVDFLLFVCLFSYLNHCLTRLGYEHLKCVGFLKDFAFVTFPFLYNFKDAILLSNGLL